MPAMLDDPSSPAIFRTSGELPLPRPGDLLPLGIYPRPVTLRDRVTIATVVPFQSPADVPANLLSYLHDQFSREIEKGDTYPMLDPLPFEAFGPYWFGVFGAIMMLGDIQGGVDEVQHMARSGCDWEKICLGSFYIKPNYPGRSSHVCNGGFLVTDASRNRGVGRLMGETYLEWAPRLVSKHYFSARLYTNICRATHIPSSTLSTRPMSPLAVSGMLLASSASAASRGVET